MATLLGKSAMHSTLFAKPYFRFRENDAKEISQTKRLGLGERIKVFVV
jgi:hypothetical protein